MRNEHKRREEEYSREISSLRDRLRELEASVGAKDAAVAESRSESAAAKAEAEKRVATLTAEVSSLRAQLDHSSSTRGAAESARELQLEKVLSVCVGDISIMLTSWFAGTG